MHEAKRNAFITFVVALMVSSTSYASMPQLPSSVADSLNFFKLIRTEYNYPSLNVILNEERVTELVALNVIDSVCSSRFPPNKKWDARLIQKVEIRNMWETQSYTFTINGNECDEYGKTSGDESKAFLKSHMSAYP